MTIGLSPTDLMQFRQHGFVGPIPLLTRRECSLLIDHLNSETRPAPAEWSKGAAATDWLLYRMAANPRLLEVIKRIIGDHVVLWGCSIIRRRAGEVHPWHVDIESSGPDGHYISAWIGLENTRRNGALELIAGSHCAGATVQQIQSIRGYCRGEAPVETVLEWARELNSDAALVKPELDDGDALLFDGRIWHGARNPRTTGTRTALLLQFASAASPVRMHDEAHLEWPFPEAQKPPTVVVHGEAAGDINHLVPPPMPSPSGGTPMLSTCVMPINLPLEEEAGGGWKPYQLFGGATRILDHMNCHVSVLSAGCCPHPPHEHHEEEILIILNGNAELLIADGPSFAGARVEAVEPGAFAYYPAFQYHTIRNPGTEPVTYLMFKWHTDAAKSPPDPIGTNVFRYPEARPNGAGWQTQIVMEGTTGWLGKLHCHASWLEPGAGYAPHVDAYDVAILTLSGRVETLDRDVPPHSVIYYAAGEKHGMRNIGDEPAHYLVFEFHPSEIDLARRLRRKFAPAARQMLKRTALAMGVDLERLRERMTEKV